MGKHPFGNQMLEKFAESRELARMGTTTSAQVGQVGEVGNDLAPADLRQGGDGQILAVEGR